MNGTQVRWLYNSPGPIVFDALGSLVSAGRIPTAGPGKPEIRGRQNLDARQQGRRRRWRRRRLIGRLLSARLGQTDQNKGENQQRPGESGRRDSSEQRASYPAWSSFNQPPHIGIRMPTRPPVLIEHA